MASKKERRARIVKFIVVAGNKVIFGKDDYRLDSHATIALNNGLLRVAENGGLNGGGIADMKDKRIYGKSTDFGPYDQTQVQQLLGPEWNVEPPSDYSIYI